MTLNNLIKLYEAGEIRGGRSVEQLASGQERYVVHDAYTFPLIFNQAEQSFVQHTVLRPQSHTTYHMTFRYTTVS